MSARSDEMFVGGGHDEVSSDRDAVSSRADALSGGGYEVSAEADDLSERADGLHGTGSDDLPGGDALPGD